MITVFVVQELDWAEASTLGVFTTKEKAEQFITDNSLEKHYQKEENLTHIEIEEFQLDDPICYGHLRVTFSDDCECGCKNA